MFVCFSGTVGEGVSKEATVQQERKNSLKWKPRGSGFGLGGEESGEYDGEMLARTRSCRALWMLIGSLGFSLNVMGSPGRVCSGKNCEVIGHKISGYAVVTPSQNAPRPQLTYISLSHHF